MNTSNTELLQAAWKQITDMGYPIWCGIAAAIAVFVLEMRLITKYNLFSGPEKKIAKAEKAGHVIKAQLACYDWLANEESSASRTYKAKYQYYQDGKLKTKYVVLSTLPSDTMTLYYLDNPNKVFARSDLRENPLIILIYIIPLIVSALVAIALGYKG